jgi:heavy metal sensor kinase
VLNVRSLRFRLALWYFATVAVICSLAAGGYWLGMRAALDHALDQGLRYRLIGLRHYLGDVGASGHDEIAGRLNEVSALGELYQVFDANGALIAQSQGLARHGVAGPAPREPGSDIRFESGGTAAFPVRLAWQHVTIRGQALVLGVADPQRKYEGVLTAFTSVLLLSVPVILALAAAGGVWLGRRALSPVARITEDARAITDSNLSARLAVPDSRDELQQLSETLNEMLARIEESFTRVRQFTADASHELRAPMTLIHTAAQHSLRRERSREELVESMQQILRESRRTVALVDDLLLLARGDAATDRDTLTLVDAAPLVRDAAIDAATAAASLGIHVELDLRRNAMPVRGDEAQLRRLLVVLVDNALKYTPAGGRVVLQGDGDDQQVSIAVADTGIGISPEDLPHVFERFWRADRVRSREAGGTGLGLAIAQQIADRHGARLDVQSDVGRGSVFTIRFSRADG